jgi:hydroxymethylpyrimidine pyrophosphatase-like HAD family hydrolase
MNKDIEDYIAKNYYIIYNIALKMTKQDPLTKDLLHEVILQLYDKQVITLKNYDDNSIKYYIVAVLRINYFSKTSPFHYRIRRERQLMNVDVATCWDISYEQQEFETERIYQLLEENYAELDWFKKSLLDMYLSLNSSMNAVSRKTNIPKTSISRYINEIRKIVKEDIKEKLNR